MRALRTLWPCLLLIASAAPAGEIHKWVDKDGVTHYSDAPQPEEQLQTTVVDVRVSQPSSKPYLPATKPVNATTAPATNTPATAAQDASKAQVKNGPTNAELTQGESAEAKRARLIKECEASRGVDCKSPETLARMEKKESR
jgi:hypothetical protein